ncbi:hypothetical protein [Duganella sp. Root198D2]|uniref:hypothetical protein n=1 Tax=Duganella sp. Root198D2 TaxID=1736489 RepID=UPI00070DFC1E|nr:hypothetical protein [Duganella sp. Root198D2]KRC02290.1 hypothetical protein ASE26_19750 [Duganella sp. Root198D2]
MKRLAFSLALLAAGTAGASDFGSDDLVRQGRYVFDKAFTPAEQDRLKPLVPAALDNIAAFYGERKGGIPDFFFCKSVECARFLAGAEWRSFTVVRPGYYYDGKYYFERAGIVINSMAGRPTTSDEKLLAVLAHELSHVEVHARTGGRLVPAWFNEGLASAAEGHGCKPGSQGIDDLNKLAATHDWHQYTRPGGGKLNATYCQANLEVQAWAAQHGGFAAIVDLLAKLPKKEFSSLYGGLVTQQAPVTNPVGVEKNDS